MDDILKEIQILNEEYAADKASNYTLTVLCDTNKDYYANDTMNITECFTPTTMNVILSTKLQTFFKVLYCSTSVLALIGNVAVLLVQLRCYRMPPLQNLKKYLINLAISDIVFGVLCVPFIYTDLNLGRWPFPAWLCPLTQYAQLLSVFVTANTLMIIGIERYSAILYPFSGFYRQFKSYSYYLIGFVWVIGAAFAYIPIQYTDLEKSLLVGREVDYYYQCSNYIGIRGRDRKIFVLVNFTFTFGLPSIVLACTYVSIVSNFIQNRKALTGSKCYFTQTIRITLIIIILYGMCWAPIKVFQLLHEFDLLEYCTEQQFYTHRYFYIAFHWLAMANSFVNPIVYTFTSQRFRHDLRRAFKPF